MRIDKHSTVPLYVQLKEALMAIVRTGGADPDGRIPSEVEICAQTGLSRPTVRQAVAEMVAEGVLVKVKGKGTYVAPAPEKVELRAFNGFQFSVLAADSQEGRTFLSIDRIAGDREGLDSVFGQMPLSAEKAYACMTWMLQTPAGVPYAFCTSYVPQWIFPNLVEDLRIGRRMLDVTANKYAYLPTRAHLRIELRTATPDESIALDIPRGQPVFVSTSRMTSRSGSITEYVVAVLRTDLCVLTQDSGKA